MISNPCSFFTGNSGKESFTYEGGSKLYHFSPNDNNLSRSMENNLIFFADSPEHGLDVVRRMFQFAIDCKAKYLANQHKGGVHYHDFKSQAEHEMSRFHGYITAIDEGLVTITEAPMNQFFIAGWASNDNIH